MHAQLLEEQRQVVVDQVVADHEGEDPPERLVARGRGGHAAGVTESHERVGRQPARLGRLRGVDTAVGLEQPRRIGTEVIAQHRQVASGVRHGRQQGDHPGMGQRVSDAIVVDVDRRGRPRETHPGIVSCR